MTHPDKAVTKAKSQLEDAYTLQEIHGFLIGASVEFEDRRREITLDYAEELQAIVDRLLKGIDEQN